MDVQLSTVRLVCAAGLVTQFKFPPEFVIIADSHPYIRLRAISWTLTKIVCEENPDATTLDRDNARTVIAGCNGLNKMMQLRNVAQAAHL